MIEWEESIVLNIPFDVAREKITILGMEQLFTEIVATEKCVSDDKEMYKQTAAFNKKQFSYLITVVERHSTSDVEEFIFTGSLKDQFVVTGGIRLVQQDGATGLTYSGLIQPVKKSFALSTVLRSAKKQILQKVVVEPLDVLSRISC